MLLKTLSNITNGKDDVRSTEQHLNCCINDGSLGTMGSFGDILQSFSLALGYAAFATMEMTTNISQAIKLQPFLSTPFVCTHLSSIYYIPTM